MFLLARLVFLDLFLASLGLGSGFLPISVFYRDRDVRHIVADAEPAAVVTTWDLSPLIPPEGRRV